MSVPPLPLPRTAVGSECHPLYYHQQHCWFEPHHHHYHCHHRYCCGSRCCCYLCCAHQYCYYCSLYCCWGLALLPPQHHQQHQRQPSLLLMIISTLTTIINNSTHYLGSTKTRFVSSFPFNMAPAYLTRHFLSTLACISFVAFSPPYSPRVHYYHLPSSTAAPAHENVLQLYWSNPRPPKQHNSVSLLPRSVTTTSS